MAGDEKNKTWTLKDPPVAKPKPPSKPKPATVTKDTMSYEGQNARAAIWAAGYFLIWLVQRLWCHLEMPRYCELAEDPLDVLTDLLVLGIFALGQAWWCDILEKTRFEAITKSWWFPAVVFLTPLIISALGRIQGLEPWDRTNPGEDFEFSSARSTMYIFGLVVVVLFIAWHFAHAWLTLPGVKLISGAGGEAKKAENEPNPHGMYVGSRVLIVAYVILFTSFLLVEDEGLNYRGPLIAWTLSLLASFPHNVSTFWLAITTGIFLQGIGSNQLRFLGCS